MGRLEVPITGVIRARCTLEVVAQGLLSTAVLHSNESEEGVLPERAVLVKGSGVAVGRR
jgi:hypothetical protein